MNKFIKATFLFLSIVLLSCDYGKKDSKSNTDLIYPNIKAVGAMRNVMWKGLLGSSIKLDTIANRNGLYGLGPQSYLKGELLINNGMFYLSKVTSDSTMTVEKTPGLEAPFFVYGNVSQWKEIELPDSIKTIQKLEGYIDDLTMTSKRPFVFKLKGGLSTAVIHIQNLPDGTKVSSPEEAHTGQVNYILENENAEIIGFFSTEHKGVFTHHDSFLHMHLITADASKMGHLDELEIDSMTLYLPIL